MINSFRIIPVLLLHKGGLVKSVKFKDYRYVGDPVNAVRIFNEKEVDELIILDIDASKNKRGPNLQHLREIASEAFIPLAYGGGIRTIDEVRQLFNIGVEKVILNSSAFNHPSLITEAARHAGSQSVVVAVDIKKNWKGSYRVHIMNGTINTGREPVEYCKEMEAAGAGEIFLNNIDRDGTFTGFDMKILENVSHAINIPLIACGGAASLADFSMAFKHGASAAAAGSFFVFKRPHNAVLITYPSQAEIKREIFHKLNNE